MKKLFLLIIFVGSLCYGQKISVTPNGLKNENDTEKTFLVLDFEGKTSKLLYDSALNYVLKTYENPENSIKGKIDSEYLKFDTHVINFIVIKNSFAKIPISIDYITELSFKDGKVKVEFSGVNMYDKGNFGLMFMGEGAFSGYYIYNKKGDLKKPDAKTAIENYFNSQMAILTDYLQDGTPVGKW
jgi:hypothetical protein